MVRSSRIWILKKQTASQRCRHICYFYPPGLDSARRSGSVFINLHLFQEALPVDREAFSADWRSIMVDRQAVSVQWNSLPVQTEPLPALLNTGHGQRNAYSGMMIAIPAQRNALRHIANPVLVDRYGLPAGWKFNLFYQDACPDNRNIIHVDGDDTWELRDTVPDATNGAGEDGNPLAVVRNGLRMHLLSDKNHHFTIRTARFHQFGHHWFILHSTHTHGDSCITMLSINLLSRRHNACYSFTRQ